MTVHTAKGLEFPVVFITGLEERIFPHARSVDDDSAVEEERRLCYVAVTRARTQLHLSRVRRRRLSGQELPGVPSRFLRDLPAGRRRADRHGAAARVRRLRRRARGAAPGAAAGAATKSRPRTRSATSSRTCRRGARARRRRRPRVAARAHGQARRDRRRVRRRRLAAGPGLQVGAKLRHPSFGVGEVRAWQGAGADLKVTMQFPGRRREDDPRALPLEALSAALGAAVSG